MKKIERFNLIDRIGRKLQEQMSYNDIKSYLSGFKVNINKETSGVNSKWVYVKDLLVDEDDSIIFEIADELEIEHNSHLSEIDINDVGFWKTGYFKLFISHISGVKVTVSVLQKNLLKYGISSFVAHEDIEPTKIWQTEIEKALFTMDGLAAILTTGFNESKWTEQEVGVAIGRNILIIPVIKDMVPYGLFGKYQGLKVNGKNVSDVAKGIYKILVENRKTRLKMLSALSDQLLLANNEEGASFFLQLLLEEDKLLNKEILEKLYTNALNNKFLKSQENFDNLNELFKKNEFPILSREIKTEEISIDDLPF